MGHPQMFWDALRWCLECVKQYVCVYPPPLRGHKFPLRGYMYIITTERKVCQHKRRQILWATLVETHKKNRVGHKFCLPTQASRPEGSLFMARKTLAACSIVSESFDGICVLPKTLHQHQRSLFRSKNTLRSHQRPQKPLNNDFWENFQKKKLDSKSWTIRVQHSPTVGQYWKVGQSEIGSLENLWVSAWARNRPPFDSMS